MSRVYNLILTILAIPIVIIIRLLSPFVLIRLGQVDISRIGNFSLIDWYIRTQGLNNHKKRILDFFFFFSSTGTISNKQLVLMFKRIVRVLPFPHYINSIYKLNNKIIGFRSHFILFPYKKNNPHIKNNDINKINLWTRSIIDYKTSSIMFNKQEELHGYQNLKALGLDQNKKFITFHARDPLYMKLIDSNTDWSYHDYRDSGINNYLLAAKEMTKRDYYSLRIGKAVNEKINISNPKIIDYANSEHRTDKMDIFLFAKNKFMICSDTGVSEVALFFNKPLVRVNWVPICRLAIWAHNEIRIFKKFFHKKEGRVLRFNEIKELGLSKITSGVELEGLNIKLVENTPEEILAATLEMEERLNGTWVSKKEDEELQKLFWSSYGPEAYKSSDQRIGAQFLRDNKFLLD